MRRITPRSAWFLHAEAGYRWNAAWKPRLSVEYDFASGDRPGGDYGRFDTLFGFRRGEFAPSGLYAAIGRANINAPGLRLEVEPGAGWDAFAGWRPMWLASDTDSFSTTGVRDAAGASGDFAGNQFEARIRYWIIPQRLRAETNLVFLRKGRFLKDAPNAPNRDDTRYGAVDVTLSF